MRLLWSFAAAAVLVSPLALAKTGGPSDDEVARRLIAESIASYPGNCPCPYNSARNGSACGRRSAYSKPGGYAPLCYRQDISHEDIARYRQRTGG